jgi:DNA-directed RNA polymerase subunit omega
VARITIEDCIEKVPNRFHLVQLTAIRAKQLKRGANAMVKNEDNKEVVIALREIAAGLVSADTSVPEPMDDDRAAGLTDEATVEVAPLEPAGEGEAAVEEPPAD